MNKTALYELYSAYFPFLESSEQKIRPVIVISKPYGEYKSIAVVPVTSKAKLEPVDVAISDWHDAELTGPSVARVHRLTTILQSRLAAKIGTLEAKDINKLKLALKQHLGL